MNIPTKITTITILLFLLACAPAPKSEEGIDIGVLAPITGPVPTCGENMIIGLELAQQRLEQKGIEPKILPIIQDTKFNPKEAVTSATNLYDAEEIDFIIGACSSSSTLAVAPLAEERQKILFTPISFADKISEAGDFVFRFATTPTEEVPLTVPFVQKLGADKVAIIYLNNDYGVSFKDKFTNAFENAGGKVLLTEAVDPPESDFRTILAKIKDKNVKLIILPATLPHIINVLKQAQEFEMNDTIFVSTQVAEHETLLEAVGDFAEKRLFFTSLADLSQEKLEQNEEARIFAEMFAQQYPDKIPTTEIIEMYDTTMLLVQAINRCGENTECVRDWLYATSSVMGVSGENYIDTNGDVKHKNIVFKTVKDNNYVTLT